MGSLPSPNQCSLFGSLLSALCVADAAMGILKCCTSLHYGKSATGAIGYQMACLLIFKVTRQANCGASHLGACLQVCRIHE